METQTSPIQHVRDLNFSFGGVRYDLSARTHIMGIVNVTPDSFSDGGKYFEPGAAVDRARAMVEEGADFIDIGGESTRPGSVPLTAGEEMKRVLPVVERLAASSKVPISVDTYKAAVAERALAAGASIVNDISGLHFDPALAEVTARAGASLVLMHIKGTPATMQSEPVYDDLVGEIGAYLGEGIARARAAGVEQIFVDPGIGFGKTLSHNLEILRRLRELQSLGCPVLIGPSRKSFIGKILDAPVAERMEGTAAASAVAIMNGASVIRVHDVKEISRVARVVDAIVRGGAERG